MNKAEKSLRWVVNQIPDFKPTTNEEKMLVAIKLYSEAGAEEIKRLEAENAALRERFEKVVELPVKIGDTVYFIPTYNGKPIWGVQRGIVQMVGITRQGYHVKIRDRADFNKTYMFGKSAFLSKEQAEARLAELKGEKK